MSSEVVFNKLSEDAILPTSPHHGDVGWDLASNVYLTLEAGQTEVVPTGISVKMPMGSMYGQICSRSGMAANHGVFVLNSPGIIDNGYVGEIKVILHNSSNRDLVIYEGGRIAQIVFSYAAAMNTCPQSAESRSNGGLGSSGA